MCYLKVSRIASGDLSKEDVLLLLAVRGEAALTRLVIVAGSSHKTQSRWPPSCL